MRDIVIVSACRTPIGSFMGSLSSMSATRLGAAAIAGAIERSGIAADEIQEVFMGNVLSAGLGQAPATQASRFAGLPDHIPSTTINKVCASGMKAIMLAAQSIALGEKEVVLAGGMESMSNTPYYVEKGRQGYKFGHGQLTDGMIKDGLWDVYNDFHMGSAADLCSIHYEISRQDQDEYAIKSYKRSQLAIAKGSFKEEIVEIVIEGRGGINTRIDTDEEPAAVKFEKIPTLKPVFGKDGTVTAANASSLNDGAAALILMSMEQAQRSGLKPLARILGWADAQQAPEKFTTSPAKAIPLAIQMAGLNADDINYYEINEAFAVVSLANNKLLNLDEKQVNVNGGAVSLGHPLGASGARIVVTLIQVLKQKQAQYGVAGICNGGGGASAIVIENLQRTNQ